MTQPTPSAVNMTRAIVTWTLRGASVILLGVGGYLFLKRLLFAIGFGSGGFNMMFRVYTEVGEQMSTYRGLAMLAIGLALALLARRISRWVVAMPETGCPRCGYDGAVSETCPECGLSGLVSDSDADTKPG